MQFDAKNGLGRVWVTMVQQGIYNLSDVPKIGNLPEVVAAAVQEEKPPPPPRPPPLTLRV